ncbi:MAG: S-methyl-5'-thioadenosine phosphorylase [Thaumarchaeota archaeon]|nr:S-methyl-5'-thioadenosine phosphorylase [Nitrososphaerota archaeon]
MKQSAEIAVIGGTGFYGLFEKASEHIAETPYGPPSGIPSIGTIGDRGVAFLPRHGYKHELPPHVIPYLANIWILHTLGVKRIIAPCAVGSLSPEVKPGDFVLCDQFINFTRERKDTFYDGPKTTHISAADPYCPELRKIALEEAQPLGLTVHPSGTVVVIQGPRFSTRAESKFFRSIGGSVINMTQYPEAILARELEICYLNISLITDYDVGLEGDAKIKPVTHEEVLKVFNTNIEKLKKLIVKIIPRAPQNRTCLCSKALEGTPWR